MLSPAERVTTFKVVSAPVLAVKFVKVVEARVEDPATVKLVA